MVGAPLWVRADHVTRYPPGLGHGAVPFPAPSEAGDERGSAGQGVDDVGGVVQTAGFHAARSR